MGGRRTKRSGVAEYAAVRTLELTRRFQAVIAPALRMLRMVYASPAIVEGEPHPDTPYVAAKFSRDKTLQSERLALRLPDA